MEVHFSQLGTLNFRRKQYLLEVNAVRTLQKAFRAHRAKRRSEAATKIQASWRKYIAQSAYQGIRLAAICLQSHWRRVLAERELIALRTEHHKWLLYRAHLASTIIQRAYRR